MRRFGTQGPVNPEQHYVVPRTEELTEFIKRIKEGPLCRHLRTAPRQGRRPFLRCYGHPCCRGTYLPTDPLRF